MVAVFALAATFTVAAATSPFTVRRSMYPDLVRGSTAYATVSAPPFEDAPGVLDDGVSEYYTVTDNNGGGVAITVEKNQALGTVRIEFATGLTGGPGPEYQDTFDSASFTGSSGTYVWTGDWQESGESDGAGGGILRMVTSSQCTSGSCFRIGHGDMEDQPPTSLTREADLGGVSAATLSYDFAVQNNDNKGTVYVKVSGDGGSSWTTLATYGPFDGSGSESFDITPHASPNTQVRFEVIG